MKDFFCNESCNISSQLKRITTDKIGMEAELHQVKENYAAKLSGKVRSYYVATVIVNSREIACSSRFQFKSRFLTIIELSTA